MKKIWFIFMVSIVALSVLKTQAQDLAPYIKIGDLQTDMNIAVSRVKQALTDGKFEILGSYNPEENPNLKVIAFTRADLKNTVIKVLDRGALAAVLKVGLIKKGDTVTVSYTNPMYIFNAFLRKETPRYLKTLQKINDDVKLTFAGIGNDFTGFGGGIPAKKLWKYHYKIMMPYFSDPAELKTFSSFVEGLNIIESNLKDKTLQLKQVYKLVFPDKKVAVFGIALLNKEDGEAHFLPKIGEENIAAMPYEIILQNKTLTMLKGKYRLALSWPELSMGTFMGIMSTPGDIKDMLKRLSN